MSYLEKIVHQLPELVFNLKLNLGNSQEIMQQVVLINNIQEQLKNLQQIIIEEMRFDRMTNSSNSSTYTMLRLGATASLLMNKIYTVDTRSSSQVKFITAKFGNPDIDISIKDLQAKIDGWIEWGDFLHVISADILSDLELVSQLNYHSDHAQLPAQVQKVSDKLNINLAFSDQNILQEQLQLLRKAEAEAIQVLKKLNYIFHTIKTSHNFLTILLGVLCFCGQSGLSLEWLDDEQELIISSDGKFQELTDIINEGEKLGETVNQLIVEINSLIQQAEQSLEQSLEQSPEATTPTGVINEKTKVRTKQRAEKIFRPVVIGSSLVVLLFSGWIAQIIFTDRQEKTAVTNFQSALKLGLAASDLAKDPPHPLTVWQQAESKWEQATELLASIPEGTSVYGEAKDRLVRYDLNRMDINKRANTERKAQESLKLAEKLASEANFFVKNSPQSLSNLKQAQDKWQQAINLLKSIPPSTSIHQSAQEILPSYQVNYAVINSIIKDDQ